ncbi:hypothetical protein [Paraburkholderia sp. SIMBA_054]|uniref:hypothetical protein n=1 Tax=Paraburkholderia sp. SIMBA_054 TaxID=3085795 RepID=UPI00397B88B1
MLSDHEFEAYLASHSLTSEARVLMRCARERGPGVEVTRRGPGASIVRVQSRKMGGCAIPTTSRTLNGSAAKWHEYDNSVLEYYANVHTFTVDTHDEHNRVVNRNQHTVNYLVLADEPFLEDWREECHLLAAVKRDCERWVKVGRIYRDEHDCWHDRELETLSARIGLHHVLRTSRDIPRIALFGRVF